MARLSEFLASPIGAAMGEIYEHWFRSGEMYPSYENSGILMPYQSIWDFVSQHNSHTPGVELLTFRQFLQLPSDRGNIEEYAKLMFAEMTEHVIFEAQTVLERRGGHSSREIYEDAECLEDEEVGEEYITWLYERLLTVWGDHQVRDVYYRDNGASGFYMWSPEFGSASVEDEGDCALRTDAGVVHLHLDEDFDQPEREWNAFLFPLNECALPAAVACGMTYSSRTCSEMVIDADSESEVDAWWAAKFVDTHPDAQARLELGPIAFLTLWERRADAPAGSGRAVLKGALSHLQGSVTGLATLVVCLRPLQLVNELANEPAQIATARLDALDAIRDLCEAVVAGTGLELRYITPGAGEQTPWVAAPPPLHLERPLLQP